VHKGVALLLAVIALGGCRAATSHGAAQPTTAPAAQARPLLLVRAHAHNDYEQTRPLLDAFDNGFCSIEADIVLVDGELRVAHSVLLTTPGRTLESLYLDPLRQRIAAQGERVYRDGPTVILLIDFKLSVPELYPQLRRTLEKYSGILTTWQDGTIHPGAVTVVLTGSHPPESALLREKTRYVAIDGGERSIDSRVSPDLLSQISLNWHSQLSWDGLGPMPEAERAKLRALVARVHARGRTLRLWDAPELPAAWEELLNAGVDYINTDDLPALRAYLVKRATTRPLTPPGTRKAPTDSPRDPGNK